jgi:transcriptional regulator with XRE-family HTH domain
MTSKASKPTLGQQIRDARVAAELSLRALARQLEVAPSYMNDIENDRRVPSEAVLLRIASGLGLDSDRLLAAAGRVGEGAQEYIKANPTAGVLFRRVSDAGLDEKGLKRLLEQAEEMIIKRDEHTGE